jgi:DNA gyrase subunit A
VHAGDDVMLVTDIGRLIRVPADQVRITGRQAMGVTLFRVDAGEHVTSVFPVLEDESEDSDPASAGEQLGGEPGEQSGGEPGEQPGEEPRGQSGQDDASDGEANNPSGTEDDNDE